MQSYQDEAFSIKLFSELINLRLVLAYVNLQFVTTAKVKKLNCFPFGNGN